MSFRFSKSKWLLLTAMVCGLSMIFLDGTILPVTLPTIQKELGISPLGLQWIVNVYFLAEASFVIVGGKLGDIFGIRRVFITGIVIFALSSLLGGFSQNFTWLLTARAIQGFGAALMAPSISAIIIAKFSENERGKAFGITVATSGLFLSCGPFLGGVFTEYFSWRWVFFINIFISIFGVILTLLYVPISPSKRVKIDLISVFLFISALFLFTLGAMEGGSFGWLSITEVSLFMLAFSFALLFYFHYRRDKSEEPFFDFSLFRNVNFFIGSAHAFIVQFILINAVFWAIFFQNVLDLSPTKAGFWTFLSTVPILFVAPLAGFLSDKYGVKLPTTLGFIGHCLAFAGMILFSFNQYFPLMIISLIIYGLSVAPILTPTAALIMSSASPEKRGLVSGIYNTTRFAGATFGIAILGSIYTGVIKERLKIYLYENHSKLSHMQEEEISKIYLGLTKTSVTGVDVVKVREDAKKAAFKSLKGISSVSFVLSVSGLLLIYGESARRRKNKGTSL